MALKLYETPPLRCLNLTCEPVLSSTSGRLPKRRLVTGGVSPARPPVRHRQQPAARRAGWSLGYADFAVGLTATVEWSRANEAWWRPLKRATEARYAAVAGRSPGRGGSSAGRLCPGPTAPRGSRSPAGSTCPRSTCPRRSPYGTPSRSGPVPAFSFLPARNQRTAGAAEHRPPIPRRWHCAPTTRLARGRRTAAPTSPASSRSGRCCRPCRTSFGPRGCTARAARPSSRRWPPSGGAGTLSASSTTRSAARHGPAISPTGCSRCAGRTCPPGPRDQPGGRVVVRLHPGDLRRARCGPGPGGAGRLLALRAAGPWPAFPNWHEALAAAFRVDGEALRAG